MRFDNVHVAGCASWLPPAMTAAEAVRRGLTDQSIVDKTGMRSVTVADRESGPQMAVRAGRRALRHARLAAADVNLVLHSALYYQGHDMWAPASYVQRYTVGAGAIGVDVRQTSNGGMASLYLAAAGLTAGAVQACLLTTGDRFCLPGIDRWRSDPGTVFADGGAALLVTRDTGFARLRNLVLVGDGELEQMHRGADPFSAAPQTLRRPLDVHRTTRDFLALAGASFAKMRMSTGQQDVLKAVLAEAELTLADVDHVVLPNFGRKRMVATFFRGLGIDPDRTGWDWGRTVGHLGAGDQFAGLARLAATGALRAGDRCLLLGVGGGFSWSGAVLDIVRTPA